MNGNRKTRALALVALFTSACPAASPDAGSPATDAAPLPPGVVAVDTGLVRGAPAGPTGEVWAYKGIPYAAPPVGDLRWRPPAAAAPWAGERDAADFGDPCMQIGYPDVIFGAEDCLTLNVWTPAAPPAAPLPVMFWIHGGDNVIGSGSEPYYEGSWVAEHGPAVVVTINYRLGPFGFLAHNAFAAENPYGSRGNYGLLDQIAALEWVQRNIAAFGGDPTRVLVHGQSAGSVDSCALVASPLAAGLFSAALLISGGCHTGSLTSIGAGAFAVQNGVGCDAAADVAACMRAATAEAVAATPGFSLFADNPTGVDYNPIADGWVLPMHPLEILQAGAHNHVPVIAGTTADEYTSIIDLIWPDPIPDEAAYIVAVHALWGVEIGDMLLAVYPVADFPSPRDAVSAILSDDLMHCPTRRVVRALAATQTEPVRRYVFAHVYDDPMWAPYRAAHGYDVDFAFHTFVGVSATPAELALSETIAGLWHEFAATGDPGAVGATPWPAYDLATEPYVVLDDPPGAGVAWRDAACDLWDVLDPQ